MFTAYYTSSIGLIEIAGTAAGIVSVNFVAETACVESESHPCVTECVKQLAEYFQGVRQTFSLNLILQGTAFQQQVWRQLLTIPYGQTASYQELAAAIGKPAACRAVGRANGRNPLAILVPCHRIIGRDGKLTGYGGGLWRKEWLLRHEKVLAL